MTGYVSIFRQPLAGRRLILFAIVLFLFLVLLAGAGAEEARAAGIGDDFMGGGPLATVGAYVLNVRTGPGVGYPVVTTVTRLTPVEMLYRWGAGLWIAIEAPGGVVGWVNATWLNADFATGNLPAWNGDPTLLASPGVVPTVPPLPTPTPAPPAVPTPAPIPSLTVGDDFMGGGPLATVGAYLLNVRRGPGVGYPVITTIPRNLPVEMLYRWNAGLWIAIQLPDGRIGWVNATWLNADFATGMLPAWNSDPTLLASQ